MNGIFKKTVSVLMTFVFAAGILTVAKADNTGINYDAETTLQQSEVEESMEITTQPHEDITQPSDEETTKPPEKDDHVIGKIYICSRWSSVTTTGHIWVYILNTSEETLKVGLYDLVPGEGVSLATFGFTRSDGFGVYYNMEAYRNDKYCDESCISLEDDLTREELDSITEKLLIANYWDPIYNCVFFACSIWNRGGNRFIVPFPYPPVARLQIMMWGNNEVCEMEYQPPENSYKQRGFGDGAYLENVCQKSLDA